MTTQTIEAPAAPDVVETQPKPAPLKLSEAIKLGSVATVQSIGSWVQTGEDGEKQMCALSTAWYALTGGKSDNASQSALSRMLGEVYVPHPVTGNVHDVASIVVDLNDDHKWNRKQIAEWLETYGL